MKVRAEGQRERRRREGERRREKEREGASTTTDECKREGGFGSLLFVPATHQSSKGFLAPRVPGRLWPCPTSLCVFVCV